ncbi:pullulanase-type alpha-1,6-glucosidase [Nonomuraea thailandensis]
MAKIGPDARRDAADGHATIHYRRPDGAYDGWGLHLWGDAIADGTATDWANPRMPDGVDAFGAHWRVPLKDAALPPGYVIHRGDTKDPGPDQHFTPAAQPEAYVVCGTRTVHPTRAAAENKVVLHYRRPDGNHDGWGLHVWGGAAAPTDWASPLPPARADGFGAVFEVPLAEGAKSLSYIIHKGDDKDLPADQSLDVSASGHEVWRLAGTEGLLLPRPAATAADADLSKARAHWIDRDTVAWRAEPSLRHSLAFSATGGIAYEDGDLTGDLRLIRLAPGTLSEEQRRRWPHLAAYPALKVDPRDADLVRDALRGQVVAVARDAAGTLVAATGVQIPGVLDDLYAKAATAALGPSGQVVPRLGLWAPTARMVELALYGPGGRTVHRMRRDDETGVWSVRGLPTWLGREYTYLVTVYSPEAGEVVTNEVTDPYSLDVTPDGERSRLVSLDAAAHRPPGWDRLAKPAAVPQDRASIYELHVRDFSASDATVPAALRGTYAAFQRDGAGMRALRALAADGLTHVHLLPAFDFATVPERAADRTEPSCDLAALPPDSEQQQECVARTAAKDSFNWGYDPLHYTVPEGSYATRPDERIKEFRGMVAGLNRAGLRVVMDVVYNHTHSTGVLDPIVPGYYHRLLDDGAVATSTCCANTAPEHLMMGRLVVDSIVTWAKQYKIDGFRFDLMGHHPKANLLAVRRALDELTLADDGVDGKSIILYGEGWNFGEVANDARFEQATQANLAGTGIGTFTDRLRDAVRGGTPFDADPRVQGFGSGLAGAPNGSPANGTAEQQRARLANYSDIVRIGLTGNLRDYVLPSGAKGSEIDYNGSPAGYTAAPGEAVTYVDAHDNETLFDALAYKLPQDTPMADRVRMHTLSLATAVLSQGTTFVHAGTERLRSKSLDRNSYDSGDWFNRLLWDCAQGNGFGAGLPPRADNEAKWPYARPLLADPALRPGCADIEAARARYGELLRIRASSPAFALGTLEEVQRRLSFPASAEGVIAMHVDTGGLDPRWTSVTVVFNATPSQHTQAMPSPAGRQVTLHPVQAGSADPVVRTSSFDPATGTLTVPARTVAVFVGV